MSQRQICHYNLCFKIKFQGIFAAFQPNAYAFPQKIKCNVSLPLILLHEWECGAHNLCTRRVHHMQKQQSMRRISVVHSFMHYVINAKFWSTQSVCNCNDAVHLFIYLFLFRSSHGNLLRYKNVFMCNKI